MRTEGQGNYIVDVCTMSSINKNIQSFLNILAILLYSLDAH